MERILTWSSGIGNILVNEEYMVSIDEKPDLGFEYDVLYYETPTHHYAKVLNGESMKLTEAEIATIIAWLDNFVSSEAVIIQAIDPETKRYVGTMTQDEATEKGLSVLFTAIPDHPMSKWVDDHWERIRCAIGIKGGYQLYPAENHVNFRMYLTDAEWEVFPHPEYNESHWDWEKSEWVDVRDLGKQKDYALAVIHNAFSTQYLTVADNVPSLEQETWVQQAKEASTYLKEKDLPPAEQTPTPFIDAMLGELHGTGVTKFSLATSIMKHCDEAYWGEMGAVHGRMYKVILAIRNASTVAELDELMHEESLNHTFTWDPKFKEGKV